MPFQYYSYTAQRAILAGKGVIHMQEAPGVRIVKAGRRTYFIDTLKTKEGKGYLSITESKVTDFEKNTHSRSKILVFGEAIKNFAKEVAEAAKTI